MTRAANLTALAPLIEILVETSEPAARDRRLLDAPLQLGVAPAAALWRPVSSREEGTVWREVLARGPRSLLPVQGQVEAVAEGRLGAELPDGRRVLIAGRGTAPCVLALGGVLGSEEGTDLIEALLVAYAEIEEASGARRPELDALDRVAPALPVARSGSAAPEHRRLAHDVRNHMASIRSTQELLRRYGERLTDDERAHFRSVLEREVRRASGLLVRAVHPRREGESGLPELFGTLDPSEVVRDVVDAERTACSATGVVLDATVEPDAERAACSLDEVSLARVLRNLIVNARQALAQRAGVGRIHVHVSAGPADPPGPPGRPGPPVDGDRLRISVEDDGPGIPEQDLPLVWEEGYSAGKPGGTGIGLGVVRDLVQRAGGSVEAANVKPSGASFVVCLPQRPP
jgi:signal transduction histidine kinase